MRRKTATKRFHLDDSSRSALTRSVAGELIGRLGTDSETISRILGVAQQTSAVEEDSDLALAWRMFNDTEIDPHPSSLTEQDRLTTQAHLDTIRRLALAAEMRDDNTGAHVVRVGCYSALLAEKLGLSDYEVRTIYHAAPLHDVGQIGIPDRILMKRGKLSHEEFEIVKTHTTLGSKILADTDIAVLQLAQQIALCHHERWDGKGYPQGLSADRIPVAARIVAIADAFDAITSDRPYGKKSTFSTACEIIKREQEKQFDPAVAEVLMSNMEGMIQITVLVDRGYHVVPLNCILNATDRANSKKSD